MWGIIHCTCPLGPNVPDSNNALYAFTHLLSTYLLAYTLSKAFAIIVYCSKKLSLKMCSVPSNTFSILAAMCPLSWGFICWTAAAAVYDFGLCICFSLKRNYLLKLEVSMWSGSVMVIYPWRATFSIAKFFNNSHPIAPQPTINRFAF